MHLYSPFFIKLTFFYFFNFTPFSRIKLFINNLYFLATSEWSEVNAYVYGNAGEASTNAEVLAKSRTYRTDIQSEASGRQGVKLKNNGDYVEFTLQKPDIF